MTGIKSTKGYCRLFDGFVDRFPYRLYSCGMNPLATELNDAFEGTVFTRLFSDFGRRFYFPKGIASQAAESRDLAYMYNATIGMAFKDDGPMMPKVMEKLHLPLSRSEAVEYAPNGGVGLLRELWAEEIVRKNPSLNPLEMSTPMVVAGLTNGIVQVSDLFTSPGDTVVVPDLYWGNYRLIFQERQEAKLVSFPFFTKMGKFNTDGLAGRLTGASKAIVVLNFPNNPTGYSPTEGEARAIADVLINAADSGTAILALCDDAYFGLFYEDDTYRHSLTSLLANAHKNLLAVKVDGPTKEDFSWGLRIGFVTFAAKGLDSKHYAAIEKKLLGAIRSSVSNCSRPAQSLLIRALQDPSYRTQKEALLSELNARYRTVKRIVGGAKGNTPLVPLPFNSGYFMSFSIPGKAETLRTRLLRERGIGTISIQNDYLRVAYQSVEEEVLEPLFNAIYEEAGRLG